jgi:predicted amidohydrolase
VPVAVGIAEFDAESGLGYNTAALIGPHGYIGKYRKHDLNAQDQLWATAGNLGFPVFDTELGRISMLICYDDTYWHYARLAALHDVDIIVWVSASDRAMPVRLRKSQGRPFHRRWRAISLGLRRHFCRRSDSQWR